MTDETNRASGCRALVPYLSVAGAAQAIDFYRAAFGAVEDYRLTEPGGRIGHAEIHLGAARVMLADEFPDHGAVGPRTLGGSPVTLHLDVDEVDALAARAVAAGAKLLRPVEDQFYGERTCKLEDPFGHLWFLSKAIEPVTPEEMQRRLDALMQEGGG